MHFLKILYFKSAVQMLLIYNNEREEKNQGRKTEKHMKDKRKYFGLRIINATNSSLKYQ